jgi:hypothetical protein
MLLRGFPPLFIKFRNFAIFGNNFWSQINYPDFSAFAGAFVCVAFLFLAGVGLQDKIVFG